MSLLEDANDNSTFLSSTTEDFLIREIKLTHDPDGRQLDSELLLHKVESTFNSMANVSDARFDAISMGGNIEKVGSKESLSLIIYKISNEILCRCFEDENFHRTTMALLETLCHYRWDAKVVIALASFAKIYGFFWLIMKMQSDNALAVSLATVKQLPRGIGVLKPKFKALDLLINTMVKLTKLIIISEDLSFQHELLDDQEAMNVTKSEVYIAAYWILRSILQCSSKITDIKNSSLEQVYSDETVVASWALHSVGRKLDSLYNELRENVHELHQHTETRSYHKLLNMFKENQVDNQNVLQTLFGIKSEFPPSEEKVEQHEVFGLKNKVVILLISKPELLPIDKVLVLVQWMYDHPQHKKFEGSYDIIWLPIKSSGEWKLDDKKIFEFLSNSLPWLTIQQPWSFNSTVITFIEQEWKFKDDPLMVVLNVNGEVTNSNAMDMVWIWGPLAFPFSTSREKELWEQENWSLSLMINGINPLLTEWVEGGKNLCIYGSDNLDWIGEFILSMTTIKNSGIQLEVIYVGCMNPGEKVKSIIDIVDQENLCTSLTFTKMHLFWFRLESIRRSIGLQKYPNSDKITKEVTELLDFNDNGKGWAVIGRGSSTDVIKLQSGKLKECTDIFPVWCKNVAALGLVGAIRTALEPPFTATTCNHTELVPFQQGLIEETSICSSCKRPLQKFVVYKCDLSN